MPDPDRVSPHRLVSRKLADPTWSRLLTVRSDRGEVPLTIATPEELMVEVLERILAVGGKSNLILVSGSTLTVVAVILTRGQLGGSESVEPLNDACTAGLFVERLTTDGHRGRYQFVANGPNVPSTGLAELSPA